MADAVSDGAECQECLVIDSLQVIAQPATH